MAQLGHTFPADLYNIKTNRKQSPGWSLAMMLHNIGANDAFRVIKIFLK